MEWNMSVFHAVVDGNARRVKHCLSKVSEKNLTIVRCTYDLAIRCRNMDVIMALDECGYYTEKDEVYDVYGGNEGCCENV